MPTNRRYRTRKRKADVHELDISRERILLYGRGFAFISDFADTDEMQRAWQLHREEIRAKWAAENLPGTRCFAEWLFEIVPRFGERATTEFWTDEHERHRENWLLHGILHVHTIPPIQEPEAEYLARHGLLDEAELRLLRLDDDGEVRQDSSTAGGR